MRRSTDQAAAAMAQFFMTDALTRPPAEKSALLDDLVDRLRRGPSMLEIVLGRS